MLSNPFAPPHVPSPGPPAPAAPLPTPPSPPPGRPDTAPPAPRRRLSTAALGLLTGAVGLVAGLGLGAGTGLLVDDVRSSTAAWSGGTGGAGESAASARTWSWVHDDGSAPLSGSPHAPWTLGDVVRAGDWEIVLGTPREATAEVLAYADTNLEPTDGLEYWIVPYTATYDGDAIASRPDSAIDLRFVDDDGMRHRGHCGTYADSSPLAGSLTPGESLTANLCLAIPVGGDGLWVLAVDDHGPAYLTSPES